MLAAGANVNHSNASRSPLMYTVRFRQDLELISQLLQLGAYPQAPNDGGKAAYILAELLAEQWTKQWAKQSIRQWANQRNQQSANQLSANQQPAATANIVRIPSAR